MTRIVVHVAWRPELDPDVTAEQRDGQWAQLLAPLFERAVALGGRVVGWAPYELVLDFAWDGLYDAVDFLVDAPLAPELASAMSVGVPQVVADNGRIAIVVGPALRRAALLVKAARPGEVLLDPELVEAGQGRFGVLGETASRPGRSDLPVLVLDPENPLLELEEETPNSIALARTTSPSVVPGSSPSSRAPAAVVARHVDRLAHTTLALDDTEGSLFPIELASVLKKRDAESLQELARSVRPHGPDAAERLEAIAELAGGRAGEALRRLRRSKQQAEGEDPTARCRAALALAVALMAAGRPYEAALEGLYGMARAREGKDQRGERACARFLSQLAGSMGDSASEQAWASLGQ